MEALLEPKVESYELQEAQTIPLVLPISEFLTEEWEAQQKSTELIKSVGDVALQETVEKPRPINSLYDAIQRAAAGDSEARALIEANVRTDVTERTIKAGHVLEVKSEVNEAGKILQHGQYLDDVHRNALKFASENPAIRKRTEAEIRNGKRIEMLNKSGVLGEYYFVVVSRCEDGMSDGQLDELGFFSDTKSCALQITDNQQGSIVTESAFVAGVKQPGIERHDQLTVIDLGDMLGADWHNMGPAEIIDAPILVHKSVFKDGVIDLVRLYDQAAGSTFFGEDKPAMDYRDYKKLCEQRQGSFEPQVAAITRQLINEARSINSPVAAFKRLAKLSQDAMVERAVVDDSINPRVFGAQAAVAIDQARLHYEQGHYEQALNYTKEALSTAVSSSCPSAVGNSTKDPAEIGSSESFESTGPSDQFGSLKFKCKNGHENTRPRGKLIDCCKKCGVSVKC
jgi:hypothetical protein